MNCREYDERIALHVAGDLNEREARRVEDHLAACAECREYAVGLAWTQDEVKALAEEPVEEAALDAIRVRVMARVRKTPPVRWSWQWAYAGAAAIVVAGAVWLWQPRTVPVELPRPVLAVPRAPETAFTRPVRPWAAPAVTKRRKAAEPAEPLMVKLETNDPDVVIYWIVENKGG